MNTEQSLLREQILRSKLYAPAMMDGEEVFFLESTGGMFFVKRLSDEEYIKKEGKFLKIPFDKVVDCRLLYLSSPDGAQKEKNKLQIEKENAIAEELKTLQEGLAKKAQEAITIIDEMDGKLTGKYGDEGGILATLMGDEGFKEARKRDKDHAKAFFKRFPKAKEYCQELKKLLQENDYETLHVILDFQFGKPMGSFSTTGDLTAAINIFGAKNIEGTLDTLKEKGQLAVIAKINVEKRYAPEH